MTMPHLPVFVKPQIISEHIFMRNGFVSYSRARCRGLPAIVFSFRFKILDFVFHSLSCSAFFGIASAMKHPFLLVHASLFALCLVGGAAAHAESMTEAVAQALQQHPSVIAAIANRDALSEERREYVSDYFPELNLSLGTGRLYADNSTSRGLSVTRGVGYSWINEGNISLRQTIFDGFETNNRVDAATARQSSAHLQIMDVRETLAMRAIASYLEVMRNQETLGKLKAHNAKLDDYIKRIELMVDEGVVDESMAAQARDVRAQLKSTEATVEGLLASAMSDYNEVIGHEPETVLEKPAGMMDIIEPDVEKAVALALQNHPALKAAHFSESAYEHDADAEKASIYPDLTGEVSYMKRDQADVIGGEAIDARAMLRVNWVLQTGGEQFARMKKTQHRQDEAEARFQERARQVEKAVRSSYADLKSSERQVTVLQDRVRLSRDLKRTQETQFEGARISLLQLMQTENALFNSEMSLLNGEYRHLASQYAVLAGIGKLQESLQLSAAAASRHE